MTTPKSIIAKRFFFVCILTLLCNGIYAQAGKDGAKTISTVNAVVNDYTNLISDAVAGATSIQAGNNTLITNFVAPLSPGDLLFIIQVQGATMNSTNTQSYGEIISYQNCGNNEFAVVASVSGNNTINLTCPLQFSYTAAGKTVVVRAPRFLSLVVNGGANITCPSWDGSAGGIVAIEVLGTTTINGGGAIEATGRGFRGGSLLDNTTIYGAFNFVCPTNEAGAEKGEGIAGWVSEYDVQGGRYCRGAPANGGGGANAHNTGGGGGANSGNISSYNGLGNPDVSNGSWTSAWNLETPGFASSTSSGGGKGGYSFSATNMNALVVGPNNVLWGGEDRRNNGGLGGHPLDYSSGKYFMGGGGGAGEQNDLRGGAGGTGGGIVVLQTFSSISGSGQVAANGVNGFSTLTNNGTDGAGGGGGGGVVLLRAAGMISGISINANGGNGGSQILQSSSTEAEGPGGGGGGGYIAVSGGTITKNANGGQNGITNAQSLTEFPPNGATKGGAGINNGTLTTFRILTQTVNICDSTAATLTFTTIGFPPPGVVYSWYNQPTGNNVLGTGTTFTTPILTSPTTFYVGACPGTIRVAIQVNITNSISASFTAPTVCSGSATTFTTAGSSGINSWNWNFGNGSGTSTQQNPTYSYPAGGTYVVTLTFSNGICTRTTSQIVTVNNLPVAGFTSNASSCGPLNVQFSNSSSNATGYSWDFGDGSAPSTQANPLHIYSSGGTYTVVLTASGPGCSNSISHTITMGRAPTASFGSNNNICQSDTVVFQNLSSGNGLPITSYSWDFDDGSPLSSITHPRHFYSTPGTYSVTLTTTTSACSDDTTININVIPGPVASFSVSDTSGCTGVTANFNNTSSGTQTFAWNFGDGSGISNQISPSHIYANTGTYTVTLIAVLGTCSDTIQRPGLIHVYNKPKSSFNTASVCLGDSVQFNNLSIDNGNPILSYQWNFGDGNSATGISQMHLYDSAGTYSVILTVNSADCSDDTTINVTVNSIPEVAFTSSTSHACDSATIQFNNLSIGAVNYKWNFGDGDSSSSQSPAHTYSSPGFYSVSLTVENSSGCSLTRTSFNMINIHPSPMASIISSAASICKNDCISFNANSSPDATTWSWSFVGALPSTSTIQNPGNVCYPGNGNFNVTLVVSNGFCESTHTSPSYIHVADCSSKPKAGFILSDTVICEGGCIDFVDLSTNAISWQWFFPGSNTPSSTIENPANICYPDHGMFNITLVVANPAGYDTVALVNFIQVDIVPATPVITLFIDTLISSAAPFYQWYFNNVPISGANSQMYVANLSGDYFVVTSDVNGCTASSSPKRVSLVGIEDVFQNLFFQIYPNPVNDKLSISIFSEKPLKLTVSLMSILGSIIFSDDATMINNEKLLTYDLKDLAQGMYFIRIESNGRKLFRPILKN